MLTHGSLFSGIGGFDLAAQWMGWENVFHCEINPFGRKVLSYYWPNAKSYENICSTDFSVWRGKIDILSGGFPCQPYSTAGKRLGKEDDRHLWPEMLRAIREISPRWVVGENVRGLVNWSNGLVFEEVQADLETEGYEVQPFLLPASGVNAPHQRERIWFIAYSAGSGRERERKELEIEEGLQPRPEPAGVMERRLEGLGFQGSITNSDGWRWENRIHGAKQKREAREFRDLCKEQNRWSEFPTQSPVCSGNDGLPSELDGITFPKWRNESIKSYGNAVVPQVVYQIFKAIESFILLDV